MSYTGTPYPEPLRNTVYVFADLSDFVSSDFFSNNQHIITKYPPSPKNLYILAVPPYKLNRIWVISVSSREALGYHTCYTVDAKDDTFKPICKELDDIGGHNQTALKAYRDYDSKTKIDNTNKLRLDATEYGDKQGFTRGNITGYNSGLTEGYNQGLANQPKEDNDWWSSFKDGVSTAVGVAKMVL